MMKRVVRSASYSADLDDIERSIARNDPHAAARFIDWLDEQVARLADPAYPRRIGRVRGTFELILNKRYLVVFLDSATTVTVLNVIHTRRRYP